jgi:CHAD domain-containing protein
MVGREGTAGEMLAEVVGDLAAKIAARTPAALADEPDAVHQLRTTVRRLRNVLAAFGLLVDPATAGGLRARLATYGELLGRARDLEVRAEWSARVADEVGLDPVLRGRLELPLLTAHDRAHQALVLWWGSEEAAELSRTLAEWAAAPAVLDGAARPAAPVAREVLTAQAERVLALGADYRTDAESTHALRKAGRRLRHTADAVTRPPAAVLGQEYAALGVLGERVQVLLGDHRDAMLLAEHVRGLPAEDVAAYRPVVDRADRLAADAIEQVPAVLAELRQCLTDVGTATPASGCR